MASRDDDHGWAQWLGEDEAEQSDIAEAPSSAAESYRHTVESLRAWARAPEPSVADAAPFDPLTAGIMANGETRRRKPAITARRLAWATGLAAALLLALAQVQFSVSWGAATFAWGAAHEPQLLERLDEMETTFAALEDRTERAAAMAESAGLRTVALEEVLDHATAVLARNQQREAQARHNDIQVLMAMSGGY